MMFFPHDRDGNIEEEWKDSFLMFSGSNIIEGHYAFQSCHQTSVEAWDAGMAFHTESFFIAHINDVPPLWTICGVDAYEHQLECYLTAQGMGGMCCSPPPCEVANWKKDGF